MLFHLVVAVAHLGDGQIPEIIGEFGNCEHVAHDLVRMIPVAFFYFVVLP